MSTRSERIRVFEDTQEWIREDIELAASVVYSKSHTKVYWEDEYPQFDYSKVRDTEITVTRDRSYQAAMRLVAENEGCRVAVMNFANAFHAGGGVTKGAGAQEESLCRTSTLYPLLYRKRLRDTFYKHHHTLSTPKASDALVYIEDVVICKTDVDLPERMPREQWVNVDVITVAAPDLRQNCSAIMSKERSMYSPALRHRKRTSWCWAPLAAVLSTTIRKWWREPTRWLWRSSPRSLRRSSLRYIVRIRIRRIMRYSPECLDEVKMSRGLQSPGFFLRIRAVRLFC